MPLTFKCLWSNYINFCWRYPGAFLKPGTPLPNNRRATLFQLRETHFLIRCQWRYWWTFALHADNISLLIFAVISLLTFVPPVVSSVTSLTGFVKLGELFSTKFSNGIGCRGAALTMSSFGAPAQVAVLQNHIYRGWSASQCSIRLCNIVTNGTVLPEANVALLVINCWNTNAILSIRNGTGHLLILQNWFAPVFTSRATDLKRRGLRPIHQLPWQLNTGNWWYDRWLRDRDQSRVSDSLSNHR